MAPPPTEFLDALSKALGPRGLAQTSDLEFYAQDRCRGGWPVEAGAVALPATVAEVQEVLRLCSKHRVPVVPSGGRTGLAGAATATAGELVLSTDRLRRILEVDPAARTLRCEAGVTVQAVQEAAREAGLEYPVDWAAVGSSQVGGSIATNAGGVRVIRYGLTRDWVSGLKVVLASGELVEMGGSLVKNNTGYDLRHLFVGSEGTLGVVVEATLRLAEPPAARVVALAAVPSDAAVLRVFARLRNSSVVLSAFECFDAGCVARVARHRHAPEARPFDPPSAQHVLVEVEVPRNHGGSLEDAVEQARDALTLELADAQEAGELDDAVVAASSAQASALWAWREEISESLHPFRPHKADVAVPVNAVSAFVAQWREAVKRALPDVPALCFGHVGDGNLHLNLLWEESQGAFEVFLDRVHAFDETLYGLVREHKGSVSAEHGIGLLKRDYLGHTRSTAEIDAMRGIKAVLDPQGLLNPGKIFRL